MGKEEVCDIARTQDEVEKVEYHPSSTLSDVFDLRDPGENKTMVYLRSSPKDQLKEAPTINSLNKDRYIINNTVDIKKLLKCSTSGLGEENKD